MGRTMKQASVRKEEILDAAAALFAQQGFDHTSTQAILNAVGIARGTLYHHFRSKEEILDALIQRQGSRLLTAARQAAQDRTQPIGLRLARTVAALRLADGPGSEGGELLKQLHQPQNALLHQKTKALILQEVPQILAGILADGVEQGLLDTPYPLECMEMAVCYLSTVFDGGILELTGTQRARRLKAFIFHLERMLGAQAGTLSDAAGTEDRIL